MTGWRRRCSRPNSATLLLSPNVSGLESSRSTSAARASVSPSRSRRLRGSALLRLGAGLVLLAEALHAACGVDETLLAREERVALGAHVGMDLGDRGARLEGVAARALHDCGGVLGMDVGLHESPAWH